jgi:serine/threonine-protein kinase
MTLAPGPVTQSVSLPTLTAADEAPTLAATPPASDPTKEPPGESPATPASTSSSEPEPSNESLLSASGRVTTKDTGKSSGNGRTIGYVLGGVGLVGIGAGTYFGIVALGNKKDVDAHCAAAATESLTSNAIGCDATGFQAQKDAHTNGNIATIAIGVGAAALVTGVILILVSKPADKAATAIHVSPTVPMMGAGGGAQIGGAF